MRGKDSLESGGEVRVGKHDAGLELSSEDPREARRSELLAYIEQLERVVLSGEATLDDYGALALAQRELERGA